MKQIKTDTKDNLSFAGRELRGSYVDLSPGSPVAHSWDLRDGDNGSQIDSRIAHTKVKYIMKKPRMSDMMFEDILIYLLNLGIPINRGTLLSYVEDVITAEPYLGWLAEKNILLWCRKPQEPATVIEHPREFCHKVIGDYYYRIFFPTKHKL